MILDSLIEFLGSSLQVMSQYLSTTFNTFTQGIEFIYNTMFAYVNFLFEHFPLDNGKKTFILSLLFFFAIIGLVIIFGGSQFWNGGNPHS